MAVQNSTVERPALDALAMTPADEAAHQAASYVRSVPVDSDPDADEALRRVRGGQARTRRTARALASVGSW